MKSIRKNLLYNAAYQMLLIVLPLVTTPYISRVLGVDGVGTYSYTYTVARYFVMLAMLGVANYGNRSIASVRDDKELLSRTFWQIYGLQFLCAIVAFVVYFGYILLFENTYFVIALIQGFYVLSALFDISWLFFGLEEFQITVTRSIAVKLISLVCIFIFVRAENDLWIYTLIMSVGVFLSQACLWGYMKRLVLWRSPSFAGIMQHLRAELILFVPVIAVSLYKMMDKIMLEGLSTITQVGYYESAEKIMNIPLGMITALGTVMLPRMSNLAAAGKERESRHYIYHSIIFAMFMASGMMFGLAGIAENLIPVFLGSAYDPCISLLQTMAPTICFIAWANVIRTQYLIPNHMDRSYIISVILGAGTNLIVNLALIPGYEAMGAVIGTICAEGVVCVSQTIAVRKDLDIGKYLKTTLPMLLFGGIMFLIIQWVDGVINGRGLSLVCEIVIGGGAYAVMELIYLWRIRYSAVTQIFLNIKEKLRRRR